MVVEIRMGLWGPVSGGTRGSSHSELGGKQGIQGEVIPKKMLTYGGKGTFKTGNGLLAVDAVPGLL